jgi:hypothetical protein
MRGLQSLIHQLSAIPADHREGVMHLRFVETVEQPRLREFRLRAGDAIEDHQGGGPFSIVQIDETSPICDNFVLIGFRQVSFENAQVA